MMNKINRFITLALGSGISILLSPGLAYPVDINSTIPEKYHGICISVVDLLPHQFTTQSLTILSESSLIRETNISSSHSQEISIDQRGSERHR